MQTFQVLSNAKDVWSSAKYMHTFLKATKSLKKHKYIKRQKNDILSKNNSKSYGIHRQYN